MKRYGRFFFLDPAADLSQNLVKFRYLGVKQNSNAKRLADLYPVYCTIGLHSIDFYYHGKKEDKSHKKTPGEASKPELDPAVVNEKLLSLPLSANLQVKDDLTNHLNSCFHEPFSLAKDYHLVWDEKSIHYSNLASFNIQFNGQKSAFSQNQLPFRKLILDFLFDLEHSEVFKNSGFFEEAEARLKENFLMDAILAKAEYYYTRNKYEEEIQEKSKFFEGESKNKWLNRIKSFFKNNEETKKQNHSSPLIFGRQLLDKEKAWLNCIRKPEAEYKFSQSLWFANVEEEYKLVFFNWHCEDFSTYTNILERFYVKLKSIFSPNYLKKGIFVSSFYQRETWINSLFNDIKAEEKKEKANQESRKHNGQINFITFLNKLKIEFNYLLKCEVLEKRKANKDVLKESVKWFLRRYNLFTCYRLILQNMRINWLRCIVFAFLAAIVVLTISHWPGLDHFGFSGVAGSMMLVGNVYGLLFLVFVFSLLRAAPIIGMILPRMIMAITSSWLLFLNTEELWKSNFDRPIDGTFGLIAGVLILIGFGFMYVEVRNQAANISSFRLTFRVLLILVIGLFYSLFIGSLTSSYLSKNMLVRSGYLSEYCRHVDTAQIEYYGVVEKHGLKKKLNSILKDENPDHPKQDSLYHFIVQEKVRTSENGHQIAFALPVQILLSELTPWKEQLRWKLNIFPGFILFYAVMSLFVGVFIQLIFEDKPVTEPL